MQVQRAEFYDETVQRYYDRGWAAGISKAILAVLTARGLEVSDAQRKRIQETADLDILDQWVHRTVTVASVDELFS